MPDFNDNQNSFSFTLDQSDQMHMVARALASSTRLEMLKLLQKRNMNVNELAQALDLPPSSAAMNVRVLEEAELINCYMQPAVRGAMKVCARKVDHVEFTLVTDEDAAPKYSEVEVPIGSFTMAENLLAPCGMLDNNGVMGQKDSPFAFYHSMRSRAQHIWMQGGRLRYEFSLPVSKSADLRFMELSFECCNMGPAFKRAKDCDVRVLINGVSLGDIRVPSCDNIDISSMPSWWPAETGPAGKLLSWQVDEGGTYLGNRRVSDTVISQLGLYQGPTVSMVIEVKADDDKQKGFSLYGECSGDHSQAIKLRFG